MKNYNLTIVLGFRTIPFRLPNSWQFLFLPVFMVLTTYEFIIYKLTWMYDLQYILNRYQMLLLSYEHLPRKPLQDGQNVHQFINRK